jgi:hypothetical protein
MTTNEAIALARKWARARLAIRKHLIAEARRLNPARVSYPLWDNDEHRKLFNYPSDLSEARLLALIDRKRV